jgi:hypothetical protein
MEKSRTEEIEAEEWGEGAASTVRLQWEEREWVTRLEERGRRECGVQGGEVGRCCVDSGVGAGGRRVKSSVIDAWLAGLGYSVRDRVARDGVSGRRDGDGGWVHLIGSGDGGVGGWVRGGRDAGLESGTMGFRGRADARGYTVLRRWEC